MGNTKTPEQRAFAAEIVKKIFELAADGRCHESIAYDVGVDRSAVGLIIRRKMWRDIPIDPDLLARVHAHYASKKYEWTKPRVKLAAKLITKGEPVSKVISEVNRKYPGPLPLNEDRIYRMVKLGRLPRATTRKERIAARDAKIFAMLRAGKTPTEIVATGIIGRPHLYEVTARFDGPINKRIKKKVGPSPRPTPDTRLRVGPHWFFDEPSAPSYPHAPAFGPGVPFDDLDVMPGGDTAICRCRHFIGDPMAKETLFCGRPSEPGRAYCEEHSMIAYRADTAPPRTEEHEAHIKAVARDFFAWRLRRNGNRFREAA